MVWKDGIWKDAVVVGIVFENLRGIVKTMIPFFIRFGRGGAYVEKDHGIGISALKKKEFLTAKQVRIKGFHGERKHMIFIFHNFNVVFVFK